MTLENLFTTPFKLTPLEQIKGTLASILFDLASQRYGCKSLKEQHADLQYGYTASASELPVGPRFVRITDIKRGTVDWSEVPYCQCAEPARYILQPGDVLIARTGSIGKSFLVAEVPEPAVFASYLIRIRSGSLLDPSYLYWTLQSAQFWDHVSLRRGTAQKNVNAKKLEKFAVPSAPIGTQRAIATWLASWDAAQENGEAGLPPGFDGVARVLAPLRTLREIHEAIARARSDFETWAPSVLNAAYRSASDSTRP